MKFKSYKLLIHIALFVLFISFPLVVFAETYMEDSTFNSNNRTSYDSYLSEVKTDEGIIDSVKKDFKGTYSYKLLDNEVTNVGPRNDYENICNNESVKGTVVFIGKIVRIAFWVVPFIIIILGMVDFVKAMISNDEKAIGKATSALIKRVVAGIVVALVPTIVIGIVNAIKLVRNDEKAEFNYCLNCLLYPFNDCNSNSNILK